MQVVVFVTKIKHHFNILVSQVLHEGGDMISRVDLQAACKMRKSREDNASCRYPLTH
jgi:hypothetical protein